ncbi:MAG: Lrp/AsnC family transcriptional regulator [Candidatus Marsarchaeota archaeon]|jgi:Lrp/AsnC family transcriptional regulator for asnA, asnC and gidA|nr:Lrp/AsnC family transcriptional regulator [Candidatus Marsarchaeota archaeon]
MDELDEQLINYIDSGVTKYTDIAKKMNLPLSTVHFRIKRLEREKVIRYYKGEIDWKKAGFGITAYMLINFNIEQLKENGKTPDSLLKELLELPYVKEGHLATSDVDIILKVIARDTMHIKDMLVNEIYGKKGIANTKTMIVL